MRRCFCAFLTVFFVNIAFAAQPTSIGARADQYLTTLAKQGRFSGAVLIAKGDKILLRKGYGDANVELGVPNTPETVFRIGSITKMFTAFSILQLEERGLLNLQDPVSKYVPEVPAAWSAVTIHQLLSHTSGIPDFIDSPSYHNFSDPLRIEAALKESAGKTAFNTPGEKLRYSNSGYILLGRVIERLSGKSYEQYVTENILQPAGMTSTAFDHLRSLVKGRAHGYVFDGEYLANAPLDDMQGTYSAGALHSTLDDLYRFDRNLKSGKLFSGKITQKAWTPHAHWQATPPFNLDAEYGYGWMLGKEFGHNYIAHGGWVSGFVSHFARYPDDDAVIIMLSNIEAATHIDVDRNLAAILFGQDYETPKVRTIVHPTRDVLSRYPGKYQLGPLEVKISLREDDRLSAFGTGQQFPFVMIAASDTDFFFNDINSEVQFVLDDSGKSTGCVVHLDGKEYKLARIGD